MKFKEFRKEYAGMSVQELLGLLQTRLTNLNRNVSDQTLETYQNALKTLSKKKKVYNDILKNKYTNKELSEKHEVKLQSMKNYRSPLILLGIIERRPGYKPDKMILPFGEFKETFGNLSKEELMNLAEDIYKAEGRACRDSTLETRAWSIHAIFNQDRNYYIDLVNTKRKNKEVAKKYKRSIRTIRKDRKALLLLGLTKPKVVTGRRYSYDTNLEDVIASSSA